MRHATDVGLYDTAKGGISNEIQTPFSLAYISLSVSFLLLAACLSPAAAQPPFEKTVEPLPGERWWGGFVALGNRMAFPAELAEQDLARIIYKNQSVALLLSSEGRYVWSEHPFRFRIKQGRLHLSSDHEALEAVHAGESLRDAYAAASAAHFPPSGTIPAELFFSMPQYNTWIEHRYGGEVLVVDKDHEDFVSDPAVLDKICARLDALIAAGK